MEWKTVITTIAVVSLCFLAIPIKIEPDNTESDLKLFKTYVEKFKKSYTRSPAEYEERFRKFQRSLRHIEEMNAKRTSKESARYGVTEFSDLSEDEFASSYLRPDLSSRGMRHLHHSHHHSHRHNRYDTKDGRADSSEKNRLRRSTTGLPVKFDWRETGFVTPVRNQMNCGACWAFSTVEVAETMFAINNGTLHTLSVQEMIDCAGNSNFGCNGGDICSLLMWLTVTQVKIKAETAYPMTWRTDSCQLKKEDLSSAGTFGVQIIDFTCDNFVDAEESLMATLVSHGPVAAAVNALSWQNYLGGIIQFHCDGGFKSLNHAVEIVGYDLSASVPFYIVRNSWGENFGDNGYLYLAAYGNLCGIANQVSSLDVA
ncbi:cathepsin O-like [Neodiprion lecontei]|uniref:Cathepsin O-like n=1 Tax=Neodiprion lecontei TaxID=441921 RepID=A0A6J0BJC8_NEOLC|nr:cathepsin O-like [Neodiprion lecontei]